MTPFTYKGYQRTDDGSDAVYEHTDQDEYSDQDRSVFRMLYDRERRTVFGFEILRDAMIE